jgi:Carboxypeptidase regulatory-like domain/TonB dependent receptor
MKRMVKALTLFLALVAVPAATQTLVGSVTGVVKDQQGGALPGVLVSLVGKTGTKTATTETDGTYRFSAVDPGSYSVQASMTGFSTQKQDNIAVSVGKAVTADFSMKVGGRTDEITVTGEAPVVDTQSSATQNQLSQDLLFNMPIRQGNTATNLLNFAPGINNSSAYGGDASSGNGLLIDGVDTRDPSGGTAWTFYNFNIVDEVQIQGIGAPAEYGAFSGAIVNTVTKSGGNRFSGMFDGIYTKSSLASNNLSAATVKANQALGEPAKIKNYTDITALLSGPIIHDKLFFMLSAQRYHRRDDPSGPVTVRDEVSPRVNGKLTWQPSANDTLMGHVQYDSYSIIGRCDLSSVFFCTDPTTDREDAPEWVWISNWRHLFGSKTFAEVKYTGWWGFYDLNAENNKPLRVDENTAYTGGWGRFYFADRGRHQVNLALSHFADKWGKHNFKFGVEVERSKTRDRYGYNPLYYYDYGGAPYYAYSYGYDIQGRNRRESVYAQDSWQIGSRLTINPGLRVDFVHGKNPAQNDWIYGATNVAPRFGFAFDVTGDHRTVIKGSYSQYYEGIFNDMYKAGTPGIQDYITYDASGCPSITSACPANRLVETDRTVTPIATIDPNLKHPRTDEFSLSFERAIGNDIRLSVTGLRRDNRNLVGVVYPDARWELRNLTSTAADAAGLPARTVPVYRWMNGPASENNLFVTNPDGFVYRDVSGNPLGTVDAFRNYKALMTVLSKRFSHRWVAQVSYVLAKAEGVRDNTSEGLFSNATSFYKTPTLALTNSNGELTNSRRHELKAMLGVQVPVVEVGINAYWRSLSGRPYQAEQRFASSTFGGSRFVPFSTWRTPLIEPRGDRRRDMENVLDVRLEKIFNIGGTRKNRLALYADITNVFNKEVVQTVQVRTPSLSIGGFPDPVTFGSPTGVIAPRQTTLGARWTF